VQVIKIDHVRLQPSQTLVAGALDRCRSAVDHTLAVDARHAALAREHDLAAMRTQHTPEQFLVATEAIERRGVEVGHAGGQRCQQHCLGRRRWRRSAVRMAQAHATESDRGDAERPDLALFHRLPCRHPRTSCCSN